MVYRIAECIPVLIYTVIVQNSKKVLENHITCRCTYAELKSCAGLAVGCN